MSATADCATANVALPTLKLVSAAVPPTTPVKMVLPDPVLVVKLNAPLIVLLEVLKLILLSVAVKAVLAPKVTAPAYVWVPFVIMLPAKVLVPVTFKLLAVVSVLVMVGRDPLSATPIDRLPTVSAFSKLSVAVLPDPVLVRVKLFPTLPKLPVLVTCKIPFVIVVPPV